MTKSSVSGGSPEPLRRNGHHPSDRPREPLAKVVWAFHRRRHHHQTLDQLRRARRLLHMGFAVAHEHRRAEDAIRLERHDSRAVTIKAGHRV